MSNKELEPHIGSIDGKVSSDHPLAHRRPASSHTFKLSPEIRFLSEKDVQKHRISSPKWQT